MITKVYEVTCDYCGTCLNHYIGKKPTMEELREDGFSTTATKVFCNESVFYNRHHLDYRGLIPMGLAIEAPKDMYNKMEE